MCNALLYELAHYERECRDVSLRVALENRYRRVMHVTRIGERLEETVPCIIERGRRGDLRVSNNAALALGLRAAGSDEDE